MNVNVLLNRPHIQGWELRQGIVPFAHMIAKALGLRDITVEWHSGISTAAINERGKIFLAAVKPDAKITRPLLVKYIGFVVHELLHRKFTNFTARGNVPYMDALCNAVEDIWIERRGIDTGFIPNCEGILRDLVNQMVANALTNVTDWADPAQYPFALAIWGRTYANKVPLAQGLEPIFNEAVRRIGHSTNSHDNLAIARWLYDQLNALPKGQPKDQPQEQPQDSQDEGQDEGQDQGQDQGEGEGQDDGQDKGQDGDDGQSGDQGDQDGDDQDDQGDEGDEVGHATRPGWAIYAAEVEPVLDPGEAGGASGVGDNDLAHSSHHLSNNPIHELSGSASAKLRFEIRKLFDNTGLTLFDVNRKSGALNVHALHKVGVSDRLFKQRRDVEGIDSAVMLVLDCSESMARLIGQVAKAAALLSDSLNAAEVSLGVVTFDSRAALAAPLGSPIKTVRNVLSRLRWVLATNDYAGVVLAHEQLLRHSAQRKVAFVITDGMGDRRRAAALQEQLRASERLGITTIGIGLRIDVSGVYPNAIRIDDMNALADTTFKQIKLAA